ncbi:MAG: PadR family transcriptional regulator [Acidobacteriota bacterium]|nr:PadR family transcriptional regulator [Acidobacteriota bacterium]
MKSPQGGTAHALLGFLTWGPMSGYDIKKAIGESISNFWSESYGQIYPMLKRLDQRGWVAHTEAPTGRRGRKLYRLTAAGRQELERWLGEKARTRPPRNELLLKLFFARSLGPSERRRLIEEYGIQLASELATYDAITERLNAKHADHEDLPFWLTTLRYGQLGNQALLTWCDETLETLDSTPATRTHSTRRPR